MITTALTQIFQLLHPIVLVPMGGVSGGELAAAVSKAGGLGARGEETTRTQVFDIVRGIEWPAMYPRRALSNNFSARWNGRGDDLARSLGANVTRIARLFARAITTRL
jgi:hypothetical protein